MLEIASNDGYLLQNYVEEGIGVLGVDPAEGPAAVAEKGVCRRSPVLRPDLAEALSAEGKPRTSFTRITFSPTLPTPTASSREYARILKTEGSCGHRSPLRRDLIEKCEFDTIYHEHLCYFSARRSKVFCCHGLYLNELKHFSIDGGSLRLYVEPIERVGASVSDQLAHEAARGIDALSYFRGFSSKVESLKRDLADLLRGLKSEGASIAAYGAAAKGATLINTAGIGRDLVDFVVDRNIHKHGKFMPGQRLPIRPTEVPRRLDRTICFCWLGILPRDFEQQSVYRASGGSFIIPIPHPRVVS